MVKLRLGFNNMKMALQGVHGKHCECNCEICTNASSVLCMVKKCTFYGLIDFWTSMLCPLDDVTWHKQLCLKGDCEDYGLDMLLTCTLKEDANSTSLMQWKCYQKVLHGKTHAGKNNFVLHLQYKELTTKVFLDYLQPRLKKFIYHNYVYHFQDEQYHTYMVFSKRFYIVCNWLCIKLPFPSLSWNPRNALAFFSNHHSCAYML